MKFLIFEFNLAMIRYCDVVKKSSRQFLKFCPIVVRCKPVVVPSIVVVVISFVTVLVVLVGKVLLVVVVVVVNDVSIFVVVLWDGLYQ